MRRNIRINQRRKHEIAPEEMDKIRAVAGNEDLDESEIYTFTFCIAKSGRNHNGTDITGSGQAAAVGEWVGKPVYYRDHEETVENTVGTIYDAWIENEEPDGDEPDREDEDDADEPEENEDERDEENAEDDPDQGEPDGDEETAEDDEPEDDEREDRKHGDESGESITVTMGKAFALIDDTPEGQKRQKQIENRVVNKMSCAYDVTRSECSICGADTSGDSCPEHPPQDDESFCARDLEFKPNHISFVGNPAVDGAGTVAARLNMLQQDGEIFRSWVSRQFSKWYRLNNRDAAQADIDQITEKLSAREMMSLARIEQSRFNAVIPDGRQQLRKTQPPSLKVNKGAQQPDADVCPPEYKDLRDFFNRSRKHG